MAINSRRKGKVGELEWAQFCRETFGLAQARRSQQYCGTADSQDVLTWPGTHCEVKRVQNLNLQDAVDRACQDSGMANVPYVAHRKNGKDWLVTIRAADLMRFVNRLLDARIPTT